MMEHNETARHDDVDRFRLFDGGHCYLDAWFDACGHLHVNRMPARIPLDELAAFVQFLTKSRPKTEPSDSPLLHPIWMSVQRLDHLAIGAKARSLRVERGLSLKRVARFTRMSASMLSLLERGQRRWTTFDVKRYSEAMAAADQNRTRQ